MLPIVLVVLLGLAAVRLGGIPDAHVDGLAGFVINLALPAVVFSALAGQDLRDSFDLAYVAAYAAGSMVAFLAAFAALRRLRGRPLAVSAMGALGASASNTGFIGFPVASLALGAPALAALPMTMLVELVLVIPLALALAEADAGGSRSLARAWGLTVARLARMPLIWAIAAGIGVSLSGLALPAPLATAADVLARAAPACALFVVGGTIARLRRGDVGGDTLVVVATKLLLHPLAVACAFLLVPGVPPELAAVGILFASVSMITIYPLFCARFGLERAGATALVAATTLALLTVSAVLAFVVPAVLAGS